MRLRLALILIATASCATPKPTPTPVATPTPSPTPSPPPKLTPPALRIPPEIARPTHYALDLTILPGEPTFTGRVTIALDILQPDTKRIWLNARDLQIDSATLDNAPAHVTKADDDFIAVDPATAVPAGPATLVIDYKAPVDKTSNQGVYMVAEGDTPYVYTMFEPIDARRAFPCFDEPGYKVPWKLSITTTTNDLALANAPVETEKEAGGEKRTFVFAETRPLPSYLVAFIVGPFDIIDGGTAGKHGTPLRFAVPRGRVAETRYAREVTPRIVGLLEDYFGIPYPWGKLDVAVVPRYWGTMEHPGLVALGQPLTLIKPGEETRGRREAYANIAIHELGHYWFGDYVTMAWWDDTWLNEGLTEWVDAKITSQLEPSWRFSEDRAIMHVEAMHGDSMASARALRQKVESKNGIDDAFDGATTYAKGSAVLDMFESWVGVEKLQHALHDYLSAHAWGNATSEDFLAAMGSSLGDDVAQAMRTFVDQPGVPSIAFELNCPKDAPPSLSLAQTRYLPAGSKATGADAQMWRVPVCVRYPGGRACTLLSEKTGTLVLDKAKSCPAWVAPNDGGHGYYRVAMKGALLTHLFDVWKNLSVVERARTLSDVNAMVSAGEIPAGDALALIPKLAGEPDRRVLGNVMGLMGSVRYELLPAELQPALRAFVRKTFGARAAALGFRAKPHEDDDTRALRQMLIGLVGSFGEDPHLLADARVLADKWLDDRKSVDPEMVDIALMLAAKRGDVKLFDRIAAAVEKETDRNEKTRLLGALGGFRDPELARRALGIVASGKLDPRDAQGLVFSLLMSPETRELAYGAIKQVWDPIIAHMNETTQEGVIQGMAVFCDEEHRADVERFFGERAAKIDGGPHSLASALERISLCIEANRRDQPSIQAFLKHQG